MTAEEPTREDLEAQAIEAHKILERLAQAGIAVPPHIQYAARLEALIEGIIDDEEKRIQFEYAAGDKMLTILREAQREINKATILTPGHPSLHVVGGNGRNPR